jgi:hypothetical protein
MNGVEVAEGLLDCVGGLAIFRWSVKPETAEPIATHNNDPMNGSEPTAPFVSSQSTSPDAHQKHQDTRDL